MKYLNGIIRNEPVKPFGRLLKIALSDNETGTELSDHLNDIIESYKKYIDCIYFVAKGSDVNNLAVYLKAIHNNGLKTALFVPVPDMSQVSKKLMDELDYITLENNKTMQKDECPFVDVIDWIEV